MAHFAGKFAAELGKAAPVFSDDVVRAFMSYSWPGNIRELENLVQRLVIMTDGERIEVPDLPPAMRFSAASGADELPFRPLAEEESAYIQRVLSSVGGNKSRAAEILRIDRKTLRDKIK